MIETLLPYIGTALVALLGNFLITKASKKKQNAEAASAEWQIWKDQLETASTRLDEANEANDAIMRKWQELSMLHENSVKDSADKAILIAQQKVVISAITADRDELKVKAEKYKADNAKLMKALEEVPELKEKIGRLTERVKQLEDQLTEETCVDTPCVKRKKRDGR